MISLRRNRNAAAVLVMVAAMAVVATAAPVSGAVSRTGSVDPTATAGGIYLEGLRVGNRGESFAAMIDKAAAPGSPYGKKKVRTLLESLKTNSEAGQDVVLAHQEQSGIAADLQTIDESLANLDSSTPSAAAAADADPSNYTVTGTPINQGRSWRISDYGMDQYYCDDSGCELKDSYNINFTINPARNNDVFQYNARYFPKSSPPLLEDIYMTVGNYSARGVNNGDGQINNSTIRNGTGSGTFTLPHASTPGQKVQQLLRLHYYSVIYSQEVNLRVRTGLATCKTGSNYNCIY